IEPVGIGNINDTYKVAFTVDGAAQSWLLQRLNHQVFTDPDAVMENIRLVAGHLNSQADFPLAVPSPLSGLDGKLLQRDAAGNYWRVFPFYENTYAPEQLPDAAIAFEAASAYGHFLGALQDCPAANLRETIPGFHDTGQRWDLFQEIARQDPVGRKASVSTEIEMLHGLKPVFDEVSSLKHSGALPLRVVHNDTKAGNVLLDKSTEKAVAVIDWDTIMPGTVLSDFGDMVRSFTPDVVEDTAGPVHLRKEVLDALMRGFLETTEDFLTSAERKHLMLGARWIVGEQALRFLTDYLAGDRYYKIRYPEHNLVRARNQLALFMEL
ncbi:MAG: aminoglycoside phosphotransferase family protein, partial [Saprospiraceae bacterium]|nr:aminoglycoside phosphotransferase family protein [Saprospiraceae bacterium]